MTAAPLSLYELTDEYASILHALDEFAEAHDGDVTDFPLNDHLAKIQGDRASKILNVAALVKSCKAWAEAHADEAKAQRAKAEACTKRAERLRQYVENNTKPTEKFKDSRASVWWQKNPPSVVVDAEFETDPKRLPMKFLKVEIAKSALKEAAAEEIVEVEQLDGEGVPLPEKSKVRKLLVRLDDIPDGEGGTKQGRIVAEVVQTQGLRIS